jgi:hypothetical protein
MPEEEDAEIPDNILSQGEGGETMTDCDCYKDICEFVRKYAESQVKEGESINVGLHQEWSGDRCYISLAYGTIVDKKLINKFDHLDPFFFRYVISRKCIQVIIDDILERYRRER